LQLSRDNPRLTTLWVLLISVAILIPCFWQSRIQAGDLGSHIYNAWLATQIEQGKLPGLWIAHRWTNILFDICLASLLQHFGAAAAQRIAVSAAVLIFFWGSFAFICAVSRRRPWFIAPLLSMLAYGYVFQMGFFNFYLAMGLCFGWLAIFWNSTSWRRPIFSLPLLALAWPAHALLVIWVICIALYIMIARRLALRRQVILLASCLVLVLVLDIILHLRTQADWFASQFFTLTGADQAFLFDKKYFALFWGLLLLWAFLFRQLRQLSADRTHPSPLLIQLVGLNALAFLILPFRVRFDPNSQGLVYISDRMSLATAILILALLATVPVKRWHVAVMIALAATFFAFLFVDNRATNRVEDQLERLVEQLPAGQRVIFISDAKPLRIDPLAHLLDRVCIGRCFSYGNYEAPSLQFRVRAGGVNPYVIANHGDSDRLELGTYVVEPHDVPLCAITNCTPAAHDYCLQSLHPGEIVGFHRQPQAAQSR
jgi:hypothetical protein